MAKLMKIKVCENQPNDEFSQDNKLGLIIYLPIDRLACEKDKFDEVKICLFFEKTII